MQNKLPNHAMNSLDPSAFQKYYTKRSKIMKKKLLALLLLSILSANIISCGNSGTNKPAQEPKANGADTKEGSPTPPVQDTDSQPEDEAKEPQKDTPTEKETQPEDSSAGAETDGLQDLEAMGDIKVDKDASEITLTIPAEFVGEATQEELDAQAAPYGYKITKNDDGSATYVMTKEQHSELLNKMADDIRSSLSEYVGSEDYPNVTEVTANDNFTSYTITTKSTEPDSNESFLPMSLYMLSGMYHIFTGENVDNIHIDFINADTGETISSSDSSDIG